MVALLRSAASNERAAVMFREFISREIFARIMRALDVSDPDLRASLVATQLLGVALMRYVIGVEPLASTPSDRLADMIAPTLQRYLTEPLPH
jgi:Tetracyclin repressor-like, C-terminal domain